MNPYATAPAAITAITRPAAGGECVAELHVPDWGLRTTIPLETPEEVQRAIEQMGQGMAGRAVLWHPLDEAPDALGAPALAYIADYFVTCASVSWRAVGTEPFGVAYLRVNGTDEIDKLTVRIPPKDVAAWAKALLDGVTYVVSVSFPPAT